MAKVDSVGLIVRTGTRVLTICGAEIDQITVLAQVWRRSEAPHWQCVLSVSAHNITTRESLFWHISHDPNDAIEASVSDHLGVCDEPLVKGTGSEDAPWETRVHGLAVAAATHGIVTTAASPSDAVYALLHLGKWRSSHDNERPGWAADVRVKRKGIKENELYKRLREGDSVAIGFTPLTTDWPAAL